MRVSAGRPPRTRRASSASVQTEFLAEWGEELERLTATSPSVESLWPEEYSSYDGKTCFRFVTEVCYTLDETFMPARVALIPPLDYIKVVCYQAVECRKRGVTQAIIKSRRMVLSWLIAAIDLWEAGLGGYGNYIVASRNLEMSAELLWRTFFMYNRIALMHPKWELERLEEKVHCIRHKGAKSFRQVQLPNGSLFIALSGEEPDQFRQFAARRVRCEEIGTWPYPGYAYSNAAHMIQGSPGSVGGNITIVSTAYPGWLREQRRPAGKVRGLITIPAEELAGQVVMDEPEGPGLPQELMTGAAVVSIQKEAPTRYVHPD